MSSTRSALPEPEFIRTNGIRMAVHRVGTGLPVVFCHGFPELAFSWRHQLPAIAAAGFQAIAPDLRGYGLTDAPQAIEAYDIHTLTGDLVGLLDHYGFERAIFVGHDWGGVLTWALPLLHADRVAGVAALNTPFRPRTAEDPIALMRARFGADMYIVQFQTPGVAEAILDADPERTLRFFLRKPATSGNARPAGAPLDIAKRLAFLSAIESDGALWAGEPVLTQEELDVFVAAFRRTGFRGGLNWYRNLTRNWQSTEGLAQRVDVPSLMIMAENDFVLPPAAADGMERYCSRLEKHLVRGCGHWTQQEHPGEVNRVLADWLTRHFA